MYGSHSTKIHRKRYILIPAVICYNFKIDLTMSCNFYDSIIIYTKLILLLVILILMLVMETYTLTIMSFKYCKMNLM